MPMDESKWKRSRLIPVAGIRGDREAEQRATSATLAVLSIVRDLSHELLTPMGASSASKASVQTVIKRRVPMPQGRKSTPRKPGFVDGYMSLVAGFYERIVQDLSAWQPQAPKRKAVSAVHPDPEPEIADDRWVWSDGEPVTLGAILTMSSGA